VLHILYREVSSTVAGELQRNGGLEKITSAFTRAAEILKKLSYVPAISAGFQPNIRRFQRMIKGVMISRSKMSEAQCFNSNYYKASGSEISKYRDVL
jgi:hypothetical protein